MRKVLLLTVMCLALIGSAMAQISVSGTVTSVSDGLGLPGVTVLEKGTTNGTITDLNGKFSIKVSSSNATLVFSFIGMTTEQIPLNGRTTLNIVLKSSVQLVDDVVVTALGIKKDRKSLGYAMTSIKAEELVKTGNTVNPLMSLYGKSTGVRIAATANGPTAGMIINIRNATSLTEGSSTRPLFVVDGIPIFDKNTATSSNDRDGRDRGTGINDINAEDIESIEILKGAKAAVLYGYAGANGVVLITTKSGTQKQGVGVDFSTSYTWDNVAFQPDFQDTYGSGGNVAYSNVAPNLTDADGFKYEMINGQKTPVFFNGSGSFGPKMDGRMIYWYDKNMRPYSSQPDNYKGLYNQGHLKTTSFSISNAGAFGSMRFGYSNKGYESVMVGSGQQNHVLSFSGLFNISKYLKINYKSNYYYTLNQNAPFRMQSFATYGIPRDMKTDLLREQVADENGYNYFAMNKDIANRATSIMTGTFAGEYLWNQTQNVYDQTRHHFIQSVNLTGTITPWLNVSVMGGFDMTRLNEVVKMKFQRPMYLDNKQGYYSEKNEQYNKIYGQALLNVDKKLNDNFNLSGFIGGVYSYNMERSQYGLTKNFVIENLFQFNNSSDVSTYTGWGDEGDDVTYSGLASANLSYNNYLFLEVQGRNDWTSILPPGNNSYFYPGASVSWLASESMKLPSYVKLAKFRVSLADVGRPGSRYFGNNSFNNGVYGSIPWATTSGSLPPSTVVDGKMVLNLKPERKREFEVGFEAKFFQNNRLGIDFSFYRSNSYDQIMALTVPSSSGVNNIKVNAGDIQNTGVELGITFIPVLTKNFSWNNTFNISHNKDKIVELAQGVTIHPLWGLTGAFARAVVGGQYGEIYIAPWKRNDKGQIVTDANGLYTYDKDNLKKVGKTTPTVIGGYNTNFNYKGFSLDIDFDYQFGSTLISQSNMYGLGNGTFKESLKYRDEEHGGLPYYVKTNGDYVKLSSHTSAVPSDSKYSFIFHDGVILPGVKTDGTPNDKLMCAQAYYEKTYWQGYMDITEDVVYKNDYISLRRINLSYDLPKSFVKKIKIQNANIGVFAFNVAYLYKTLPNVTPESTGGTNEFVEITNLPGVRVIGCHLKLSF